jgi:hypothetical protein
MRTHSVVTLAMLVGFALGAIAVERLHAQPEETLLPMVHGSTVP